MKLKIAALREVADIVRGSQPPDLVISISGPGERVEAVQALIHVPRSRVLFLDFADLTEDVGEYRAPVSGDLDRVEAFLEARDADADTRLLVHCHAGLSRSPAIGLFCLAWAESRKPEADREDAEVLVRRLMRAAPHVMPHEGILGMIDQRYSLSAEDAHRGFLELAKPQAMPDGFSF